MGIKYVYKGYIFNFTMFGRAVKKARLENKLTQAELGEMVELAGTTISNVENNDASRGVSLNNYLKICNVLDLNPGQYWELEA